MLRRQLKMFLELFLSMYHYYSLEYLHKLGLYLCLRKQFLYIHIKTVNPQFQSIFQSHTSYSRFNQGSILHQNILIQPFYMYCSMCIAHHMQKDSKIKQLLESQKKESTNLGTLNKVKMESMKQNYQVQVFIQNNQSNQQEF